MISEVKFRGWVEEHHQALYRHALWMTGQSDLAAELVQETYYQAWKCRNKLRQEDKVRAWLLAILRRALFRERSKSCRLDTISITGMPVQEQALPSFDTSTLLDLCSALEQLSPVQRDILLLYALHGYSYEEIAEQLEIPIGTVMSRISRARKKLNAYLDRIETSVDNITSINSATKAKQP